MKIGALHLDEQFEQLIDRQLGRIRGGLLVRGLTCNSGYGHRLSCGPVNEVEGATDGRPGGKSQLDRKAGAAPQLGMTVDIERIGDGHHDGATFQTDRDGMQGAGITRRQPAHGVGVEEYIVQIQEWQVQPSGYRCDQVVLANEAFPNYQGGERRSGFLLECEH
jgi:hypothetical protein